MKSEEEKIDQAIKNMMQDITEVNPPSESFTNDVMIKVFDEAKKRSAQKLWWLIPGVIIALAFAGSLGYTFYTSGFGTVVIDTINKVAAPIMQILPFNISPFFILMGMIYILLIRAAITLFLLSKRQQKFNF